MPRRQATGVGLGPAKAGARTLGRIVVQAEKINLGAPFEMTANWPGGERDKPLRRSAALGFEMAEKQPQQAL